MLFNVVYQPDIWIAPPLDDFKASIEFDEALNMVTLSSLPFVPFQYIAPPSSFCVDTS